MQRLLSPLFGPLANTNRWGRQTKKGRPRLGIEALEDRLVPAAPTPTDMTELARLFPRHSGPTMLYVNFDGWQAEGVSPFLTVSGDRDKDIQDILFRTAEIFSPFDVQVVRRFGDGDRATDGGATTVFVGDKTENGTGTANRRRAFTPADSSDYPGFAKGFFHQPNSDSYDTAFVDPVFFTPMPTLNGHLKSETTDEISRAIAHEAGHTFGLGHDRTDGQTDPAPLHTQPDPDIMSYPFADGEIRFIDKSFALTDTNFNGTQNVHDEGVVPHWAELQLLGPGFASVVPYRMQTQNSYSYMQSVLGARPADDFANVAHGDAVDHFADTAPVVGRGSLLTGTIQRSGDYDVFQFAPTVTQTLNVSAVRVSGGAYVNTAVLVYDGQNLVAFNNDRTPTDVYSQVTFKFTAGKTFHIVVGAEDGVGAGQYRLWVSAPGDPNPDRTGPRVLSTLVNYNLKTGLPTSILVTFDEDVDPATFSGADVTLISATGVVRHVSSVTPTSFLNREFLIFVGTVPLGDYTLKIGPNVTDFAGNRMNPDADAVFVILDSLGLDDPIGGPRKF
jgi:hypothetical protein